MTKYKNVSPQQTESGFQRREQRYVNLLSDSGFKAVFGDEENKAVIIDFLNEVLKDERKVVNVCFLPGDIKGKTKTSKGVRYDLVCQDTDGRKFVVEMQRSNSHSIDFFQRSMYYGSLAYETQLKEGDQDYFSEPVYVIGIMEGALRHEANLGETALVSRYQMVETTRNIVAPQTINCIFVQLRNFKLTKEQCAKDIDRWCYAFLNAFVQEDVPFQDEVSERLFYACDIANFSPAKRLRYDMDMMTEFDYKHDLHFSKEEGRAEGRAEGREEGRAEGKAETAQNLKSLGVDVEIICKSTGLSKEQVEAL